MVPDIRDLKTDNFSKDVSVLSFSYILKRHCRQIMFFIDWFRISDEAMDESSLCSKECIRSDQTLAQESDFFNHLEREDQVLAD